MRPPLSAALLLLPVLALAGCGSGSSVDEAGPTSAPTSTPTVTVTASPSQGASASPTASPSTTPCGTPDLLLSVKAAAGGGTAGATHQELTFSNETDHACTIGGWPGVSYVAGKRQVGAAADRTGSPTTITLQPGDVATALLTVADPGAEPGCRVTAVDKLKIYPPDNRQAVTMRIAAQGCADESVHLLTVGPVS